MVCEFAFGKLDPAIISLEKLKNPQVDQDPTLEVNKTFPLAQFNATKL